MVFLRSSRVRGLIVTCLCSCSLVGTDDLQQGSPASSAAASSVASGASSATTVASTSSSSGSGGAGGAGGGGDGGAPGFCDGLADDETVLFCVDFDSLDRGIGNPPWSELPTKPNGSVELDGAHAVSPPQSVRFQYAPVRNPDDFMLHRFFEETPSAVELEYQLEPVGPEFNQYVSDILWETLDGSRCRFMVRFALQGGYVQNQLNGGAGVDSSYMLSTMVTAGFHRLTVRLDFLDGVATFAIDDDLVIFDSSTEERLPLVAACAALPVQQTLELWIGARYTPPSQPFDAYFDDVVFRVLD